VISGGVKAIEKENWDEEMVNKMSIGRHKTIDMTEPIALRATLISAAFAARRYQIRISGDPWPFHDCFLRS
jgi:hypothetical protein